MVVEDIWIENGVVYTKQATSRVDHGYIHFKAGLRLCPDSTNSNASADAECNAQNPQRLHMTFGFAEPQGIASPSNNGPTGIHQDTAKEVKKAHGASNAVRMTTRV
jgi:hypothetical protein